MLQILCLIYAALCFIIPFITRWKDRKTLKKVYAEVIDDNEEDYDNDNEKPDEGEPNLPPPDYGLENLYKISTFKAHLFLIL